MLPAHPIPGSYWVIPGSFLAGEYPGASSEERAKTKLGKLLDAGILTFIDLTEATEPLMPYDSLLAELAQARGLECRHVRHAIKDLGVPNTTLLTRILATIEDEIAARRPVYVHCWGGIGRTGTIVGCWMVREGCDAEDALNRIAELRAPTPDGLRASPETEAQRQVIVRLANLTRSVTRRS